MTCFVENHFIILFVIGSLSYASYAKYLLGLRKSPRRVAKEIDRYNTFGLVKYRKAGHSFVRSRFRVKFKIFFLFLSRSNEKLSCSNEKLSPSNEKLSRSNEILSRSNEKLSRSKEKVSRSNEKCISFEREIISF